MNLSDAKIRTAKPKAVPYKISDGGGLYIFVTIKGTKLWRMSYRFEGKAKTLSFGGYPLIGLKEARELRDEAKKLLLAGTDPMVAKKEEQLIALEEQAKERETFAFIANEWFASYGQQLTPKHALKLRRRLDSKLFPVIGNILIWDIEPVHLLDAVRPDERKGYIETAHKLLLLCGQVMRYAKITGRVKYDVATGLTEVLVKRSSKHFAAITEPKKIGQLMRDIWEYDGYFSVRYYLRILPYVFTRPSELRLACWDEFDLEEAIWKIPIGRMKMRREHVVPLASQVIAQLKELQAFTGETGYLFPSVRAKTAVLSDMGALAALRRLGYQKEEVTLHGFRAMASTCLNEQGFRPDVIETQLAHKEPDAVRLAYNRAQYMAERKNMMQAWADYLDELRRG